MPGQIRIRVRYRKINGEWFDYGLVLPEEMEEIVAAVARRIKEIIGVEDPTTLQ